MNDTPIDPRLNEITDCLYRVATKAVIVQDDKLLVTLEDEGWYGLPGGGVDHGETLLQGMIREVEEEVGVVIQPDAIEKQPVAITSTGSFSGIPRLTICYRVEILGTVEPRIKDHSFSWVSREEFEGLELGPNIVPMKQEILAVL